MSENETADLTIIGETDHKTVEQMMNCLAIEEGSRGALLPDNHLGYSQPIGGAVAYRDHISPSGVGYDIGCGNKAVKTNLRGREVLHEMARIMDEITARISFGVGRHNEEPLEHEVLEKIAEAPFEPQREMLQTARAQLGTVGAGNHYVDLFIDEEDMVWVGVHFGSRGFGWKTCEGFLALAQGLPFSQRERRAKGLKAKEGEVMSPPVAFAIDSELGQSYLQAMALAGEYAYAGRDMVVDKVCEILGAEQTVSIHNHHNFAWYERHGNDNWWVIRKGCTPAWPGQAGFVGATMGEDSVILEGTKGTAEALSSTVHGAGRAMSRREAAGKLRWRWHCNTRDCDWVQPPNTHKPREGCPKCGNARMRKAPVRETEGKVDFAAVQQNLASRGIELRGGDAEEGPPAYKRLHEVLEQQGDAVRITHRLRPIGVAMAEPDIKDPYKD